MKLFLASLALATTTASASNPFTAPWFCHDLDCPSFTTRQTADNDVEIRSYDSLQWASTVVETDSASDAGDIAFHRLFDYISGANHASQKVRTRDCVRSKGRTPL